MDPGVALRVEGRGRFARRALIAVLSRLLAGPLRGPPRDLLFFAAAPAAPMARNAIKHLILIIGENRTFDHHGYRVRGDPARLGVV
jgi:phospholipase C